LSTSSPSHPETLVAHADRGIDAVSDVAPPIHQSAPFRALSDDEFAAPPLRVARQNQTAREVARFLERHSAVLRVHYPGLESHAQHALARRQMPGGFGGLMSFELRSGFDGAQAFLGAMGLVSRAVSFGGFESLATQPGAMWSGSVGASKAAEAGITSGLVRLSVGLEHPSDLIADIDRALHAAAQGVSL
jgi:cystathionine beta-lyase/cystathionine gamma-synthase